MPRPVPLPVIGILVDDGAQVKIRFDPPLLVPQKLDATEWLDIAKTLGRNQLSAEATEVINRIVLEYASLKRLPAPTPGTAIAFLREVSGGVKRVARRPSPDRLANAHKQLKKLLHPGNSLDPETQNVLLPVAKTLLSAEKASFQDAARALLVTIDDRIKQLRQHPRVNPANQPLRYMCALLRYAFLMFKAPAVPPQKTRLRAFVFAVFSAFEIGGADSFTNHPARLDDHLLSDLPAPPWFREPARS